MFGTFFIRDGDPIVEYTLDSLPNSGKLTYHEIYHGKLPPPIKNWYTGKSDDDSYKKVIPMVDLGKEIKR